MALINYKGVGPKSSVPSKVVNKKKVNNLSPTNTYETYDQWIARVSQCGNKKCPKDKEGNQKLCNPNTMKCVSKFSKIADKMREQHLRNHKRLYKPGYPLH
jgi:hypothetical protein